ncbi:MAG TPA: exopolysaccharide biosynthesis polyprenyl glycosylphosphotransferase [Thermoleophilaceae bacterium]|nr:exopolysaccharide biosynthesis polyprenyl glycosylphosphotransferase [Thermoleophilaceae bacterium]
MVERRSAPERLRRRGGLIRRSLLIGDVLALALTFVLVETWMPNTFADAGGASWLAYLGAAAMMLVLLASRDLYGRDETRADHTTIDDLPAIFNAVTAGAFISLAVLVLTGAASPELAIAAWAIALVTIPLARSGARVIARRRPDYVQNTVIIGGGVIGQLMARKLLTHPEYGMRLVGLIDDDPRPLDDDLDRVPVLGGPAQTARIIRDHEVERAIVAFSSQSHHDELELIRQLRDLELQVDIVPRLFEIVGPSAGINVFEGMSVVALPPRRISRSRLFVKRAVDIAVAGFTLIALLPIAIAIAVAVVLTDGRPLLYRGERIGPRGRRFMQLKFRTMSTKWTAERFENWLEEHPLQAAEFDRTQKLGDDPRTTRVGRFLRKTSLDELPQLLNVLLGDLSLVGPRPITEKEQRERYLHRVFDPNSSEALILGYWDVEGLRPGMTGYWQISGRSTMSFEERIRIDTAYLTNWSLALDISILARTARALFATRGAY